MPVIGFVDLGSAVASARFAAAFRNGLNETGYSDGKNVTVEYHWLEGRYDRLPAQIAELVGRRVAVIATPVSIPASLAAKMGWPESDPEATLCKEACVKERDSLLLNSHLLIPIYLFPVILLPMNPVNRIVLRTVLLLHILLL
jgi:hypothetical protein